MPFSADQTQYYNARTSPGLGSVGSYQVAGMPWITGSALTNHQEKGVFFPAVTKEVTIFNTGGAILRVHFQPTGSVPSPGPVVVGLHYLTVPAYTATSNNHKLTLDVKTDRIWISNTEAQAGAYELYASLTGIAPGQMLPLTGSGITSPL
tara:strand:- start:502 stop:951 length:450 start_codon:yes stop_codon:yes gene_type:complete